jgi:parallel beta-helix repeat protein
MAFELVCGGQGTQTGQHATPGGGFLVGGAAVWADCQAANGAEVTDTTVLAANITDDGATITLAQTGIGTGVVVGTLAYVAWGTGGDYVNDRYDVTAASANSVTINYAGETTKPTGDDTQIVIGGAFAKTDVGLQLPFDQAAAGDTIDIADGNYDLEATVDCDTNDGTETDRITVRGVSTAGVALVAGDTRPVLRVKTGNGALAGALIAIGADTDCWDWNDLDLNGDSGGADTADYGMYANSTSSTHHRLFRIVAHDTDNTGLRFVAGQMVISQCECYGNGVGLDFNVANSEAIGCSCHDNTSHGVTWNSTEGTLTNCLAYDNGGTGFNCSSNARRGTISNNTAYGNTGNGFEFNAFAADNRCHNNTSSANGGYGYDLNADLSHFALFTHNHANGNTGAAGATHYDIATDASGDWADAGQGSNITGDPLFVSVVDGSENLTPKHGSPLLAAGAPTAFYAAGEDDPAITNYAHIGAVTRKEPHTSLLNGGLIQ